MKGKKRKREREGGKKRKEEGRNRGREGRRDRRREEKRKINIGEFEVSLPGMNFPI